jgi:hypothetical protein
MPIGTLSLFQFFWVLGGLLLLIVFLFCCVRGAVWIIFKPLKFLETL